MKPKSLVKKLVFNKRTVSNLSDRSMSQALGGESGCRDTSCPTANANCRTDYPGCPTDVCTDTCNCGTGTCDCPTDTCTCYTCYCLPTDGGRVCDYTYFNSPSPC